MKDIYPTRKSLSCKIIKRNCKTYYGKNKDYNFYNDNGYLIIKNYFNIEDINLLKINMNNIINTKNVLLNKEKDNINLRSALGIHRNELVFNFIKKYNLHKIAENILKDNVYLYQSRINFKSNKDSNGWNIHSDFETWHSQDGMPLMRSFSFMIPLNDNKVNNGCLFLYPKSQNYFISCKKYGIVDANDEFTNQTQGIPSNYMINKLKIKPISIECNISDLILFDCNILHYSGKNKINEPRNNLYFVFNSITNKHILPFNNNKKRPIQMAENPIIFK